MSEQIQDDSEGTKLRQAYTQAKIINNFSTNCQFCKDLGFGLIRGEKAPENIEILLDAILGLKEFISLLEQKMA